MIYAYDRSLCTGCGACADACPLRVIDMREDGDGFIYPVVRERECVHCGKCDAVCSIAADFGHRRDDESFYAAYLKKTDDLDKVSSGGVFWALAQQMLDDGGVVYGAELNDDLAVGHARASTIDGAARFRRSKYLQSATHGIYRSLKQDIENGMRVLFTGTPCQIAAALLYVGESRDGLITCDVVCHGVPSAKAFRMYCSETEKAYGADVVGVNFRDKACGWKNNSYAVELSNGQVLREASVAHPFHSCYLKGLMYRSSCSRCAFATLPRISDITLADYWKYGGPLKDGNQDRGISLVVCTTDAGKRFFESSSRRLEVDKVGKKSALSSCRHLSKRPRASQQRDIFLRELHERDFYDVAHEFACEQCVPRGLPSGSTVRRMCKRWLGGRKGIA